MKEERRRQRGGALLCRCTAAMAWSCYGTEGDMGSGNLQRLWRCFGGEGAAMDEGMVAAGGGHG